jgi:hypothetical protein
LIVVAADAVEKGMTWFNIQLYRGDTCTILAAVMLLFHEQVKLIQAIQCRTIFLEIIGEGLRSLMNASPHSCLISSLNFSFLGRRNRGFHRSISVFRAFDRLITHFNESEAQR